MSLELTILGSSSATPTDNRFPSAQHLNFLDHHILIDCGEGTQMQLRKYRLKKSRIDYIFISHVHGDHILGLPGLIFSMNLMQRTDPVRIFAPKELFEILDLFIKHSQTVLRFEIIRYHTDHTKAKELLYEDNFIRVSSFPLYHRVPTTGFLFEEHYRLRKLNVQACEKHHIPFTYYNDLKRGKDYVSADGKVIPNEELTIYNGEPLRYAYASDTQFDERVAQAVQGVDLLYHESTFLHDKLPRALETMHTTALQAGMIARMAGVKQLLIGHFSSRYEQLEVLLDEAKQEFDNTELAQEGRVFRLD